MQGMQCCRYGNFLAPTRPNQYRNGISVLLVDYDKPCKCSRGHQNLLSLVTMLKLHSYKVTVDLCASQALSRLEKGTETFHLVMVNIDSYDGQSFKLLRAAVNLGVPTLLMTDHEDYGGALARTALAEGAFLCLEKPILGCTVKSLWQHVLRENKTRRDHANTGGLVVDNGNGKTVNHNNPEKKEDEEIGHLNGNPPFHVTSDDNKKIKPSKPSDSRGDNKRIPLRFGITSVMEKEATENRNLDVDDFLVDDLSQNPFYNEKN